MILHRVENQKFDIEKIQCDEVKLYFGCEVEYNPAYKAPAITEEIAQEFDFIFGIRYYEEFKKIENKDKVFEEKPQADAAIRSAMELL